MKKLSIILAIAMMAIVSTGMISCGSNDESSSNNNSNSNQNGFENVNTSLLITCGTCFMSDADTKSTTMTQLVEFFQNKVGSVATVKKTEQGGIAFVCTNQTNYETMIKLLATVKNEELDAIAKKNRGIISLTISLSDNDKSVIDYEYSYKMTIPEGTWKATIKENNADVDCTVKITKAADGTYSADVTCGTEATVTHKLKVNRAYYALFYSSEQKSEFAVFFYQDDTKSIKCKLTLANDTDRFDSVVFTQQDPS